MQARQRLSTGKNVRADDRNTFAFWEDLMNIVKNALLKNALAALAVAALPAVANSAPVNLNTWYNFGFGGPGTPLESGAGFGDGTNPATIDAPGAPWEFTLLTSGTLFVLDLFLSVDQFEIFDAGGPLGLTSAPTPGGQCDSDITCAIGDLSYSRGSFALAPGAYSITGRQTLGQGGSGAFIVETAPIPIPAAGVLMIGAMGLLGALRLRKSRKS